MRLIEEADFHLLHSGDVVVVRPRSIMTDEKRHFATQAMQELWESTGVTFVLMEDVDLTVYRPVEASDG